MPRLSISSWSLHKALGSRYRSAEDDPHRLIPDGNASGHLELLEIPGEIAKRGIQTLEICHFHFPSLEQAYIEDLRAALDEAGVELFSILIDAGDITHPDPEQRAAYLDWIKLWLKTAGRCGASHARIIAGEAKAPAKQPRPLSDDPIVRLSAQNLRQLAQFGREHGVQVITENFRALAMTDPAILMTILDLCEGEVGLCADFGNYEAETRLQNLAAILPYATSVHAKADYAPDGTIKRDLFEDCLDLTRQAGFDGPCSLIYSDGQDEWAGIAEVKEIVEAVLFV